MSKSQNDEDSTPQPPTSKRAEKKKKGSQAVSGSIPPVSVSISRPQETPPTPGPTTASSSVVDEDGWTNVHEKGNKVETSSFNRAGESTGEKKTLAEKLLPKPTPTIVDECVIDHSGLP